MGVQRKRHVLVFGIMPHWIIGDRFRGVPAEKIPESAMRTGGMVRISLGRCRDEDLCRSREVHKVPHGICHTIRPDVGIGHANEHPIIALVKAPLTGIFTLPSEA